MYVLVTFVVMCGETTASVSMFWRWDVFFCFLTGPHSLVIT